MEGDPFLDSQVSNYVKTQFVLIGRFLADRRKPSRCHRGRMMRGAACLWLEVLSGRHEESLLQAKEWNRVYSVVGTRQNREVTADMRRANRP